MCPMHVLHAKTPLQHQASSAARLEALAVLRWGQPALAVKQCPKEREHSASMLLEQTICSVREAARYDMTLDTQQGGTCSVLVQGLESRECPAETTVPRGGNLGQARHQTRSRNGRGPPQQSRCHQHRTQRAAQLRMRWTPQGTAPRVWMRSGGSACCR